MPELAARSLDAALLAPPALLAGARPERDRRRGPTASADATAAVGQQAAGPGTDPVRRGSDDEPDRSSGLARIVGRARAWGEERAADVTERWPQAVVLGDLYDRYVRTSAAALAGYIAFRTFLWILPLLLVLLAVTGLAADAGTDVEQGTEDLGLGTSMAGAIRQGIDQTSSSRLQLAWVALSGLLLATSGLLKALHLAHASVWEIPQRKVTRRAGLLARILGAGPLIVLLIAGSSALRKAGLVGGVAGTVLTAAVAAGILLGLSWILPRRTDDWRWLLPGAAIGAIGAIGLQAFAAYYLPNRVSTMSQTYGTIGVTVAAMVYLLLLGQLLVLSPLINATVWDRFGGGDRPDPAPAGDAGDEEVPGS